MIIENKIRLYGNLENKFTYHALNEFVISRGANPNVLKLEIYVNDKLLTETIGGTEIN